VLPALGLLDMRQMKANIVVGYVKTKLACYFVRNCHQLARV